MPDLYDMGNILEKSFDIAVKTQLKMGAPAPDEVSFVMGFMTMFGIIAGRVDIGLPEDVPLDRILDAVHEDLVKFGRKVAANQVMQNAVRNTVNGFKR